MLKAADTVPSEISLRFILRRGGLYTQSQNLCPRRLWGRPLPPCRLQRSSSARLRSRTVCSVTGSPVIAGVPVSGRVRTCRSTVCSPCGCGSHDSVGWGFVFLLLSNLCLFSRSVIRNHGSRELPEGPVELSPLTILRNHSRQSEAGLPSTPCPSLPCIDPPTGCCIVTPPSSLPHFFWSGLGFLGFLFYFVCGALAMKLSVIQAIEGPVHTLGAVSCPGQLNP